MLYRSVKPSDIFQCRQCGECCKGYGGTYVSEKDIETIARYLKMPVKEFISKYCQISGSRYVLSQKKNGYCVFFDNLCTIHPVKPKMCRQWPFIKAVLSDVRQWHTMASTCPGIRTDVDDHVILECVRQVLEKEADK